jgi:hypothetical protein
MIWTKLWETFPASEPVVEERDTDVLPGAAA